ncbi:MAG: hypothetical protein F7B60_06130 [Desulfurococcales archaeon]|nr:hypothetical protein [Desulfurococcales archaeon]
MPRSGLFRNRIEIYVARLAAELVPCSEFDTPVLPRNIVYAIRNIGRLLSKRDGNGKYMCALCGKGGFTKRGLYLHLIRMHGDEIRDLVSREGERILSKKQVYIE